MSPASAVHAWSDCEDNTQEKDACARDLCTHVRKDHECILFAVEGWTNRLKLEHGSLAKLQISAIFDSLTCLDIGTR